MADGLVLARILLCPAPGHTHAAAMHGRGTRDALEIGMQAIHVTTPGPDPRLRTASPPAMAAEPPSTPTPAAARSGPDFGDILDTLNPLHHLPGVGLVYRKLSGDIIAPAARVIGGALFGGPIGAAIGALSAVFEGRLQGDASPSEGASTATPQRLAAHAGRGGWIVNAARNGGLADTIPSVPLRADAVIAADGATPAADTTAADDAPATARPRPGGWIVNAAYTARALPPARVDTTA